MRIAGLTGLTLASLAALGLGLGACGGSSAGDDTGDDTTPDATTGAPDADLSDFTTLISRPWTISPGETYKCIRIQATEDMYITQFRALSPQGTHHTVLTVKDSLGGFGGSQQGEYDCDAGALDLQMLFASGLGTDDLAFPDGVAMKVSAGQWINLNLHLFNTQPSGEISGTTGIMVKTIPADQVQQEAEMVFAGNMSFSIPDGGETTISGGCSFTNDATIMAYWPHMHQIATHQKVTLTVGGSPMVLHDDAYSFNEQKNYPLNPLVQVHSGDSINVDCTYNNTTGHAVSFGDSSTDEMCFTGLYRYPKQAVYLFECSTGAGF
ncbi:MAG: hypothetical protein KC464_20285 [Myxococcales bacterium]|nr:hypothetical protein [Myxococcales bacterium]